MKRVAIARMYSWEEYYYDIAKAFETLFAGRKTITALDVLNTDFSIRDKLGILLRKDFIPKKDLCLICCDFAEHVLHIFEKRYPNDKRPRNAIEVNRRWARGEASLDEWINAKQDVEDAVNEAPYFSAEDTSYNASFYAAWHAAEATTWNGTFSEDADNITETACLAAKQAADPVDADAAEESEQKWQYDHLCNYFKVVAFRYILWLILYNNIFGQKY